MNARQADCDSPEAAHAPDWDVIEIDVLCAKCGYNLRTLCQPRCPECGREFDWPSELEHARQLHVPLFEVQWRAQPVRAWLRSLIAPLRPMRLFRLMRETGPPRAGPLIALLLLSPVTYFAVLHVVQWTILILEQAVTRPYSRFEWFVIDFHYRGLGALLDNPTYVLVPLSMLVYQLALIGALAIFFDTRRQSQVRALDMLRIMAYAAAGGQLVWCVAMIGAVIMFMHCTRAGDAAHVLYYFCWGLGLTCVAPLLLWLYVSLGLRHYCRAARAATWSGLSAVVAVLFTFAMLSVFRFPF